MKKLLLISLQVMLLLCTNYVTKSMSKTNNFTIKTYNKKIPKKIPHDTQYIIGADIGGTNSDFGVFEITNNIPELILSVHYKSKEIASFTSTVKNILSYLKNTYNITIKNASFAAAGVVSEDRSSCKVTNLSFYIDAKEIINHTDIKKVALSNDFEVIGFGVKLIDKNKLIKINNAKAKERETQAILGAGTGLGKCIMHWNKKLKRYFATPTEGGHADFSPQSPVEYELTEYIKKSEKRTSNVRWEDILSGAGISRLYNFFCYKNINNKKDLDTKEIFLHRDKDNNCLEAYNLFTKTYARCAKNFALDTLAKGGVYIAGGIAAKHIDIFHQKTFINEFTNSLKHSTLLKNIPIYVITDYNVSLYGAAQYMILEGLIS